MQHLGAAPERGAVRVEQLVAHFVGPRRSESPVRDVHAEVQDAVAVPGDQVGARREVAHEGRRPRQKRDLAVDPADPPEVLALEVAAVAPADDLHRERVGSGRDLLGDPELGGGPASLAVADEGAVHPDVKGRIDPVEPEEDLVAVPARRDLEAPPVGTYRVVVLGHERRVCGKGIELVPIDRIAVAEQFPVRGHRDLVPGGVVEAGLEEVRGPVGGAGDEVELPVAVQRDPARGVPGAAAGGGVRVRIGGEGSPGRLPADLEDRRVLPGRRPPGLRRGGCRDCEREGGEGGRRAAADHCGRGSSGGARWPDSMNAMTPKRAPQEWKGSLERRSSSPVPVIEEMFSLT